MLWLLMCSETNKFLSSPVTKYTLYRYTHPACKYDAGSTVESAVFEIVARPSAQIW